VNVKRTNTRRGPDSIIRTINFISGISWIMIFAILIFFALAKPQMRGFDRQMNMLGGFWNKEYLQIAFYLMMFQLIMSIFGLIMNSRRMKRKTDTWNASLILSGSASIIGIIIYTFFI